jgi:hypothetical protein
MQETGGLSHKQCADILAKVLSNPQMSPEKAKEELHIVAQVSDSGAIMGFINAVLAANPQSIVDFKAGKDRALGFLVGQVMKASHGKVNPAEVSRYLKRNSIRGKAMDKELEELQNWLKAASSFELPSYKELPTVPLYMEQVIDYINDHPETPQDHRQGYADLLHGEQLCESRYP